MNSKRKIFGALLLTLVAAILIVSGVTVLGKEMIYPPEEYKKNIKENGVVEQINALNDLVYDKPVGDHKIDFDFEHEKQKIERELFMIEDIKAIINNWNIKDKDVKGTHKNLTEYLDLLEKINQVNTKILDEIEDDIHTYDIEIKDTLEGLKDIDNEELQKLELQLEALMNESLDRLTDWKRELTIE